MIDGAGVEWVQVSFMEKRKTKKKPERYLWLHKYPIFQHSSAISRPEILWWVLAQYATESQTVGMRQFLFFFHSSVQFMIKKPYKRSSEKIDCNFWQWILTSILFLFKLILVFYFLFNFICCFFISSVLELVQCAPCSEINSVSVSYARET